MGPNLAAEAVAEAAFHRRWVHRPPDVTIAVLTKNALPLLRPCVESILAQVRYRPTELLICDTGSDDPSVPEYYQTLAETVPARGFGFRVLRLPDGYHFGRNYNAVVRQVRTDLFLIQNNDTAARTDYVTELVRLLGPRKVSSAGPRMLYPDGRIQHDGQHVYRPDGTIDGLCGHLHLGRLPTDLPADQGGVHRVDGNTAAGCLVRTADFLTVGGFDEAYQDIFQDVDLMIRLSAGGRAHYCQRDAVLTHVDNASRLAGRADPTIPGKMLADRDYLVRKAAAHGWRRPAAVEPTFSIIVVASREQKYARLLASLVAQRGGHTAEVIGLPNYHGVHDCLFRALNMAARLADGRYLVFCHDDVVFPPDWLTTLSNRIRELDDAGERWGAIGPAGVPLHREEAHFYMLAADLRSPGESADWNLTAEPWYEVNGLDEMCLITPRATGLRFSSSALSGFHFYAADLCAAARRQGLKCFAVNAPMHHDSDGFDNLRTEERFLRFVRAAAAWHRFSRANGEPRWRSTTAFGLGDRILIYAIPDALVPKYGRPMRMLVPD